MYVHSVIQNNSISKAYQLYILIWEFSALPTRHFVIVTLNAIGLMSKTIIFLPHLVGWHLRSQIVSVVPATRSTKGHIWQNKQSTWNRENEKSNKFMQFKRKCKAISIKHCRPIIMIQDMATRNYPHQASCLCIPIKPPKKKKAPTSSSVQVIKQIRKTLFLSFCLLPLLLFFPFFSVCLLQIWTRKGGKYNRKIETFLRNDRNSSTFN